MPVNEWYKSWFSSPFYHRLYFERNEHEAKQFINRLIDYLKPSAKSRMLDIACGRGRHSKILASYGFDVTGFDLSFDSIQYANKFAHENLHFYQHDMRLPFWINYFDFAFNFFTSFGYFNTKREHDDSIRTISSSVKPDGLLLLDYLNVHYAEEHLIPDEIKTINETKYEIHRWMDETHFYKKIIVNDPNLGKPLECTEKLTKFSLDDFTEMLSLQKMQITKVFGDYNLNVYHLSKTPRMIMIARKLSR